MINNFINMLNNNKHQKISISNNNVNQNINTEILKWLPFSPEINNIVYEYIDETLYITDKKSQQIIKRVEQGCPDLYFLIFLPNSLDICIQFLTTIIPDEEPIALAYLMLNSMNMELYQQQQQQTNNKEIDNKIPTPHTTEEWQQLITTYFTTCLGEPYENVFFYMNKEDCWFRVEIQLENKQFVFCGYIPQLGKTKVKFTDEPQHTTTSKYKHVEKRHIFDMYSKSKYAYTLDLQYYNYTDDPFKQILEKDKPEFINGILNMGFVYYPRNYKEFLYAILQSHAPNKSFHRFLKNVLDKYNPYENITSNSNLNI